MALADRHPDAERLGEYADGALTEVERTEVERHLVDCEECRAVLSDTIVLGDEEGAAATAADVRPFPRRRWVTGVAVTLAAAAALVLAVRIVGPRTERPELQELIAAVAKEPRRPIEARLAAGFQYAPPPLPTRGSQGREIGPDLRIAAALAERRAVERDTAANRAAFGIASLLIGEVSKGVAALEDAVRREPSNGLFQVDLAAAYIARAEHENRAEDYASALASAERAISLAPDRTEGWFNRALALDHLNLRNEAAKAWEDYLQRDPSSEWRVEARSRIGNRRSEAPAPREESRDLAHLAARADLRDFIAQHREEVRSALERRLLMQLTSGNLVAGERDALLRSASDVAQVVQQVTGDAFALDLYQSLEAARRDGDGARDLPSAVRSYLTGLEQYERDERVAAAGALSASLPTLQRRGVPLAGIAEQLVATIRFFQGDRAGALAALRVLASRADASKHLHLSGRTHWAIGFILSDGADFEGSLRAYEIAHDRFVADRDTAETANVDVLIASILEFLGDRGAAWTRRARAIAAVAGGLDARSSYAVLSSAARAASQRGLYAVAFHLSAEALPFARRTTSVGRLIEANGLVARTAIQMGLRHEALDAIREADGALSGVTDATIRKRLDADIRAIAGSIDAEAVDVRARNLTKAVDSYLEMGSRITLARLMLERGRLHAGAGDALAASRDFESGIEEFSRELGRLEHDDYRISYFDEAWSLFDELILQRISVGDVRRAFELAEAARSSTERAREIVGIDQLVAMLPPNLQVGSYVALRDKLVVWAVDRAGFSARVHNISLDAFESLVERYRRELSDAGSESLASSEKLYEVLIGPLAAARREPATTLVIVPDGPTARVPFAALRDAKTRRFLIEEHALVEAPSVSLWVRASRRLAAKSSSYESALVVGASVFDRQRFPDLAPLPSVDREAAGVAAFYARSRLLIGREATRRGFNHALGGQDVVHFAGHAIANDEYPSLSRLVLAPTADDSGVLLARDLRWNGRPPSVVVLNGCRTLAAGRSRINGGLSFGRQLLDSGAGFVVGTLTDVPDTAAALLLPAFHHALQGGSEPAAALRAAQMAAIRQGPRELSWAWFNGTGGSGNSHSHRSDSVR